MKRYLCKFLLFGKTIMSFTMILNLELTIPATRLAHFTRLLVFILTAYILYFTISTTTKP